MNLIISESGRFWSGRRAQDSVSVKPALSFHPALPPQNSFIIKLHADSLEEESPETTLFYWNCPSCHFLLCSHILCSLPYIDHRIGNYLISHSVRTKSSGAAKHDRLLQRCGSVTVWCVCVCMTCCESLVTKLLYCYTTGMLDILVIVCPHQRIRSNSNQPGCGANHYCVF